MGTINYRSNYDFASLGYNLRYDNASEYCEDYYDQVKAALEPYHFFFLRVDLCGGYYEGFYLEIEIDVCYFLNEDERKDALEEADLLKKFLTECIEDYEVVICYPGWCTGYETRTSSLNMLDAEIEKLKEKILEVELM